MEVTTWSWVALGIAFALMLLGLIAGRNLPDDRRRLRQRKFLLLGLVPIILLFMFSRPFVRPWTRTWSNRDTASISNSVDGLSQRSVEQQQDIKGLQEEVDKLRTELAEVNDYYGQLTLLILNAALVLCVVYQLRRRKEDVEDVDHFPLGLNQDDNK